MLFFPASLVPAGGLYIVESADRPAYVILASRVGQRRAKGTAGRLAGRDSSGGSKSDLPEEYYLVKCFYYLNWTTWSSASTT